MRFPLKDGALEVKYHREPSVRWKTISAALFGVGMFKKNSTVQIFSSEEHVR